MNDRQRRFAEAFAACGNAAQAAREAGYSDRTSRSQGQRLLTNVDIAAYIRRLQDEAAAARVADMIEVKQTWTEILRDNTAKDVDRLRAGELLARAGGAFLHLRPEPDADVGRVAVGEIDGSDVVIYLPKIQDESEVIVNEDQQGTS